MDTNGDRDKDDSMVWTRTTRRCGLGRLDGVDEDDSTNVGKDIQDDDIRVPGSLFVQAMDNDFRFQEKILKHIGELLGLKKTTVISNCHFPGSFSSLPPMSFHSTTSLPSGLPLQDLPDPQSIPTLLLTAMDTAMDASLRTNTIISANTPASPVSSAIVDVATKASTGMEVTASMNASGTSLLSPGRNADANVSPVHDVNANVLPGRNVDANVSPVRNVDVNVSPGLNITVESIRSSFLQFLAANRLLDSVAIAAGFSDSFVDGLVYCLVGHGIGIRQLTGTHDLERTIIMQQLDEAQVAQAAAETARDSMQSFVDAAAAHQDRCEQELQELRLKYHQLEEQLDDANLQLAAARGEVDFTTAQNTLMEDENTRLENDNDRLVEDRKVLTSQNEVLFKSLLSHQETLEYLLKKDSPAEVLHELGRSKEELERVRRDLELSHSSVQTLQETISLHLDTISVKDEQIY
ncbi:hypothetical protein EV360DRAFT_77047, partial [Lentinula raphanica]